MLVLVTGAGGFVGSYLTKHLIDQGYKVRALIRNSQQKSALEDTGAEVLIGDITDKASLISAVSGVTKVFHIAALFRQAGLPDAEYFKVNLEGTRNVVECAINAGVENIVYCSTTGVHGDVKQIPADENCPFSPADIYQISKLEAEKLFLDYVKSGKIRGSVIRPAMIYGPLDTRFLKLFKALARKRFFYVGKGDVMVHFIDVRDLAIAFRLASENENANGEAFIIAGEQTLSLKEFIGIVCSELKVPIPFLHLPLKPMQILGDICEAICTPLGINPPIFRRRVDFFIKNRSFDCTKSKEILGFKPSRNLRTEIKEIIESYRSANML